MIDGFTNGFDIEYQRKENQQDTAKNIPFQAGVGNSTEMWQKIMKEVDAGRYAGPFDVPPFEHFVQSPIGLVPKANDQTRLIFHLSYEFKNGNKSINAGIPRDKCWVKYRDLDYAVKACLEILKDENGWPDKKWKTLWFAKMDLKSAFRILGLNWRSWPYLVMKAKNPDNGRTQYFVDKCLPLGSSISCAHFQQFSDALKHVFEFITGCKFVTNYLDDFLFIAKSEDECNHLVKKFIELCHFLNVPISMDKTELATTRIIFLGILLDGEFKVMAVPEEKRIKALNQIDNLISNRKAQVKQLQQLAGTLNFLS